MLPNPENSHWSIHIGNNDLGKKLWTKLNCKPITTLITRNNLLKLQQHQSQQKQNTIEKFTPTTPYSLLSKNQILKRCMCFPDELLTKTIIINHIFIQDLEIPKSGTNYFGSEYTKHTLFLFDKGVNVLMSKRWIYTEFRIPKSNFLFILSDLSFPLILQLQSHGTIYTPPHTKYLNPLLIEPEWISIYCCCPHNIFHSSHSLHRVCCI